MREWHSPVKKIIRHPFCFLKQILRGFKANQGILLSGAVAYYTLLSIIPLFTLILVVLSHFIDIDHLLIIVRENLKMIVPGQASHFTAHIAQFIEKENVGWVLLAVLLFFSSLTFTVLEKSMSVIFFHRVNIHRRHYFISAIIPYFYIFILGLGVMLITVISGALEAWEGELVTVFFWQWRLDGLVGTVLYLLGVVGLVLLLTSIYMVMPVGKLSFKHALVGSVTATFLWEIARHVLVWYFSRLSMVNTVYGSLATAIVMLLFLEVGAIILLFGAQVIAEYERLGYAEPCKATNGLTTDEVKIDEHLI